MFVVHSVANIERKKKIQPFTSPIYIVIIQVVSTCLRKYRYYLLSCFCAFVGVTFQKTQTLSRFECPKPFIYAIVVAFQPFFATYNPFWRCTPTRTTKGVASCGKLSKVAPNPIYSNYTKRRIFAVLVSENTGKTLLRTYKKAHLGLLGIFEGKRKGQKVERWSAGTT